MAQAARKREEKMDMESMMEVYRQLAVPGKPHKMFARLAGTWKTKSLAWMEPGKPPVEGTGTCEQRMILDGRYLQQEFTGEMMGSKFTGINLIGYDNHTKKYVSAWVDSMSTGIFYFEGSASDDGRTITQKNCFDDPVRGPLVWRSVARMVDDDTMVYEMYVTPEGGAEAKEMEMTMTRVK